MNDSRIVSPGFPTSGRRRRPLVPLAQRGPLRLMFVITSLEIGGAETLLVNLVKRLDPERCLGEVCCLKEAGPLAGELAGKVRVHERLLNSKYDVRVLPRLARLLRERKTDCVVTVGAGDKMFWGRLAAATAKLPVVISALHSTGWPDGVGKLNRHLTRITDAFVAVAESHGRFLREQEGFPADKVHVIANGIDVDRFQADTNVRARIREELGIPAQAPVCTIVAALRPEKNHELFLAAAAQLKFTHADAQFLVVGDGACRTALERQVEERDLVHRVRFLGSRSDIPDLLAASDVFTLTSHNEANPVSILEAMACELPVVATRVGSVPDSVTDGVTGYLVPAGDERSLADRWRQLFDDRDGAAEMGRAGRAFAVAHGSLESMVRGYEELVLGIYRRKSEAALESPGASECETRSEQTTAGAGVATENPPIEHDELPANSTG